MSQFNLVTSGKGDFINDAGAQILYLDLDDHLTHRSLVMVDIENRIDIPFVFKCCAWF